ncbi:MAG: ribulose-phosphate 3-epimerase [Actinomycetaceae bacterium]|nr:ribulose-phosphate 3-epimerase [Actinomycetaceae bacterium]
MSVLISPSILNANLADIRGELDKISRADCLHLDVMDNHFVPNLSFGQPVVESIAKITDMFLDTHLMIENPDRWALDYVDAGSDSVTFHVEATDDPVALARKIRERGARAGISVKPATPIEPYLADLQAFDLILIMTVEPGFGGQAFMEDMMGKVRAARAAIDASGLDISLQVDGGISRATIEIAAAAGADNFVAGSAVYSAADPNAEIDALRELALPYRR